MNIIRHTVSIPTLADLRSFKGDPGQAIFLLGRNTEGDGQGGLYRWVTGSSSDSLLYLDTIMVTGVTDGYWQRIFLSARTLPQGILVSTGGVKTLYATGITDINGNITLNLTEDNSATGTAIFTNVFVSQAVANADATGPATAIQSYRKNLATNLKTITYGFYRANAVTVTVGLLLTPVTQIGSGIAVNFRIDGV